MSGICVVGKKAAILVESGFCERELMQAQDALISLGVDCRLISPENSLIRGWNENKAPSSSCWGADYAPDRALDKSIAGDYDVLVIPGGIRSITKLKLSESVKPFISAFMQTGKPVIAYNQAIDLLSFAGLVEGYSLAAKSDLCDSVKGYGGRCAASEFIVSKNLITLSRFRDVDDRLQRAVLCVLNGERYIEKEVSFDNMPCASKVA